MKAIKEIEFEIAGLVSFIENNYKENSKKTFLREKGRIAFLRHVIMYLETNPSERYLKAEADRLDKLISSLEGQYDTWAKNTPPTGYPPSKYRAVFNKEMGMSLFKLQRKTAYFILNN